MKKGSKEKCNSSFGIGADIESITRFEKQACKDKNCRMGDKDTNNTQLNRWSSDFGDAYTRRNLESNFSKKRLNGMEDYLSKALANMKGVKRILEVGCNTGHNLLVFSELGNFELVGIDPQISALKIGKEKGIPATLITGSVYDIHFFD
jgi:SAM-dependent methyltransferase